MIDKVLETRTRIVDYLHRELLGPFNGEREILHEEPHKRYITGTLYPSNSTIESNSEEDEEEVNGVAGGTEPEDQADDPVVLANQYLPACLGLSFYLSSNPRIDLKVTAARYIEIEETTPTDNDQGGRQERKSWIRHPMTISNHETLLEPPVGGTVRRLDRDIFDGAARLNAIWRQSGHGWLVTVSLINNKSTTQGKTPEVKNCLYQVELRCQSVSTGRIAAYPRTRLITDDKEEHILDLLYRHQVAYGVGHGCSVAWKEPANGSTSEIWTEMIPIYEVLPITPDFPGHERALTLLFLADQQHMDSPNELIQETRSFCSWLSHMD